MAKYIPGIDLASWQTNDYNNPQRFFDPLIAKEKGIKFAYIQASIGIRKSKSVDKFAQTFTEAGIPFGFYHFAYQSYSYIAQANIFLESIKPYKAQLPPAFDVEAPGVGLAMSEAWCGRVSSKLGTGAVIYTSPNTWNELTGVEKANWALEYDYWVANYLTALTFPQYDIPELVLTTTKFPTQLMPWSIKKIPWTFWQYCATGDGEFYGGNYDPAKVNKVGLDMDVFNGTLEQFNQRFGIGQTPEEPEDPEIPETPAETHGLKGRVLAEILNVRSGPPAANRQLQPVVDQIEKNDLVDVLDIAGNNAWIKIADGKWCAISVSTGRFIEIIK